METSHILKTLLQLQLASDTLAVLHLPYILSSLNAEVLQASAHTQKWTTRINSLIHSRDAAARWAGLCIAQQTAVCSSSLLLECAQSWVTVVLPLLSKNESVPMLKAAIRLLRTVFTCATRVPEFQRQVSTPNVPKYSAALIALIEKHESKEVKISAMNAIAHLVPLYPTLHRSLQSQLSSAALRYLNGSTPRPVSQPLLGSASRLYGVLHHTGGKVGAANNWRKSVDDTLAFGWGAFLRLRTTFRPSGHDVPAPQATASTEDPIVSVPLHLDRLRAAVTVMRDLLQASNPRHVALPVGSIARFCHALLGCTGDEKTEGHVDPIIHSMQLAVLPDVWALGCDLVRALTQCAQLHLQPHLPRFCANLSQHLEQKNSISLRLSFALALHELLQCSLGDQLISSRIARAVLPDLTCLLATQADAREDDNTQSSADKGKKGKKRVRGYEGAEIFKISEEVICPTKEAGELVLTSLRVVRLLVSKMPLSSAVQSTAARVLMALYLGIPHIPPSLLSPDPALHGDVYKLVQDICVQLGTGTTSTLSKSLGLIVNASAHGPVSSDMMGHLDLQLHPRAPPLLCALPHVESLSLFRTEEGREEAETRRMLNIGTTDYLHSQGPAPEQADVQVTPVSVSTPPPTASTSQPVTVEKLPLQITIPEAAFAADASIVQAVPSSTHQVEFTPLASTPVEPSASTVRSSRTAPQPYTASSIQPPQAPLVAQKNATRATSPTLHVAPVVAGEEDDDEPIPSINMDSDSD